MSEKVDPLNDYLCSAHCEALNALYGRQTIEMVSCALWRNHAPWFLPSWTCSDSFLLFPLVGHLRVFCDEQTRVLEPGDFLMLPEGREHAIELLEGFSDLTQISLHCHIHDCWGRPFLARFTTPFGRLPAPAAQTQDLMELAALMSRNPALGRVRGITLIRELMTARLREWNSFDPGEPAGDSRVEQILRRMETDLASPLLAVESLAEEVGLTSARMRKVFRQEMGSGPKTYLSKLRMRKAGKLLRETPWSISRIARECGFATDHYFHAVFRRAFDCTPSEYRNRSIV